MQIQSFLTKLHLCEVLKEILLLDISQLNLEAFQKVDGQEHSSLFNELKIPLSKNASKYVFLFLHETDH